MNERVIFVKGVFRICCMLLERIAPYYFVRRFPRQLLLNNNNYDQITIRMMIEFVKSLADLYFFG